MKPSDDNVVIKQLPFDEATSKGILIPEAARKREQSLRGEVLFVGPGKYIEATGNRKPMIAKVGDVVLFSKFAGTGFTYNGEPCLIMAEREIKAWL